MSTELSEVESATASAAPPTLYLDRKDCGRRYRMSPQSWARMVREHRAPQPTRFNRLVRWKLSALEEWEKGGCCPVNDDQQSLEVQR